MEQYTVTQAAQQTGKAERTIRQLAADKGIGKRFGWAWVFTAEDIAKLKAIHRGPRSGRPPGARNRKAEVQP